MDMLEIGNGHNEVLLTSNKIDFDGTIRFKVIGPSCDFVSTFGTLSQTKKQFKSRSGCFLGFIICGTLTQLEVLEPLQQVVSSLTFFLC